MTVRLPAGMDRVPEPHPLALCLPRHSDLEIADLVHAIRESGLRRPIVLHEGKVLDGLGRLRALARVPEVEARFEVFDGGDPIRFVLDENIARRHLTREQRALAAAQLAEHIAPSRTGDGDGEVSVPPIGGKRTPSPSERALDEAAQRMGTSRRSAERAKKVTRDGVPELSLAVAQSELSIGKAAEIASLPPEEQRRAIEKAKALRRQKNARQAQHSSESVEHYTPENILEAAREVLGGIDLDPASCEEANARVKAVRFFDQEDDGLSREWLGTIWLNPPFGKLKDADGKERSSQGVWSRKLRDEVESGRIEAAIFLCNAAVGNLWFWQMMETQPVCFTRRIRFHEPGGAIQTQPTNSNALIYFGPNEAFFAAVMERREIGQVRMPNRWWLEQLGRALDWGVTPNREDAQQVAGLLYDEGDPGEVTEWAAELLEVKSEDTEDRAA